MIDMKNERRGWIVLTAIILACLGTIYALWSLNYGPGLAALMLAIALPVLFVVLLGVNWLVRWAFGEGKGR